MGVGAAEALIAYTALITTVVAGILAFLFRDYFPIKSQLNQIHRDLYGNGSGEGLLTDVNREHDSLNDRLARIDQDHEQLAGDVKEIRFYLQMLCEELDEETDADLPDIRKRRRWRDNDDD